MNTGKAEKKTEISDINALKARVEKLKEHLEKNKKDYKTKRTLLIKETKLNKLLAYKKKKEKEG